jgi:hypothetical protein
MGPKILIKFKTKKYLQIVLRKNFWDSLYTF